MSHDHDQSIMVSMTNLYVLLASGMSSRSWRIKIVQDQLEEAEETFEVTLTAPVSTVLGSITKALVKIIDPRKGEVPVLDRQKAPVV